MKYSVQVGKEVAADVETAWRICEEIHTGLGDELIAQIFATIRRLEENPHLFQKRYGDWRVTVTKRFRYKIVYRVDDALVRVIAVRHPNQHPTTWMSRL